MYSVAHKVQHIVYGCTVCPDRDFTEKSIELGNLKQ